MYPAKGGDTNVGLWYGQKFSAKIQPTPLMSVCGFEIYVGPFQVYNFILPTFSLFNPAKESISSTTSMNPGINGIPAG